MALTHRLEGKKAGSRGFLAHEPIGKIRRVVETVGEAPGNRRIFLGGTEQLSHGIPRRYL